MLIHLLTITLCLFAPPAAGDGDALLAAARVAPGDAAVYVHVEGAADLRRRLAGRPVAEWAIGQAAELDFLRIFEQVAARLDRPGGQTFDELFGERATVIARGGDRPEEWVLISTVDPACGTELCRRLRTRPRFPGRADAAPEGFTLEELIEQDLLVARGHGLLIFAPRAHPELQREVLTRLAGEGEIDGEPLAAHPACAAARSLGPGSVAVLVQHAPPLGGWSAAVGALDGETLRVRHRSSFDRAPFARPPARISIDLGDLDALDGEFLATIVEPTEIGPSLLESFMVAATGTKLVSTTITPHLGPRRIVAVGELEGRMLEEPVDVLLPTLAVCYEIDDTVTEAQLDAEVERFAGVLDVLAPGSVTSRPATTTPGAPRCIGLELGEPLLGGLHVFGREASLNWQVVDRSAGRFWVVATHPDHLDAATAALDRLGPIAPSKRHVSQAGRLRGVRVSHHLRSYAAWAEEISDDPETLRRSLEALAGLAAGADRVCWTMCRSCPTRMDLEIEVVLSPPKSGR